MRFYKKLVFRLPFIRKIVRENKALRKNNKLLMDMYVQICEKNRTYEDTLNDIISDFPVGEKNCTGAKMMQDDTEQLETSLFSFVKNSNIDEIAEHAEQIANSTPYGMAGADYSGTPVTYRELTDEAVNQILTL